MKKMNLLKWKFAFLLSFCFVGASFAAPAYDIVESVQSFVSPEEAIEILVQENTQLQIEIAELKAQGKTQEAYALRLRGKVYSDLSSMIQQMNNVENAFNTYFGQGSVANVNSALKKMNPAQISTVKTEVNELLQD